MSKPMTIAIYMLVGCLVTGSVAVISNCLVTGEVETTLICSGALIWSLVGAAVGAILGPAVAQPAIRVSEGRAHCFMNSEMIAARVMPLEPGSSAREPPRPGYAAVLHSSGTSI